MLNWLGVKRGSPGSDRGYSQFWPRGRWNGAPITGVSLWIRFDVTKWRWLPLYIWSCGGLHWLCVMTWHGWEFDMDERIREGCDA